MELEQQTILYSPTTTMELKQVSEQLQLFLEFEQVWTGVRTSVKSLKVFEASVPNSCQYVSPKGRLCTYVV